MKIMKKTFAVVLALCLMATLLPTAFLGAFAGESSIVEIVSEAGEYVAMIGTTGNIKVTVSNSQLPEKIQLINTQTATTCTYTRDHARVSIVDNEDGTETWSILIAVNAASTTYLVKVKHRNWETEGYTFTALAQIPVIKDEMISFGVQDATTARGTASVFTAVTGSDVQSLRFVRGDGAVMTFLSNGVGVEVTDNGDGTITWTITKALTFYGSATYTLDYKVKSTWYTSELTTDVTIVKAA